MVYIWCLLIHLHYIISTQVLLLILIDYFEGKNALYFFSALFKFIVIISILLQSLFTILSMSLILYLVVILIPLLFYRIWSVGKCSFSWKSTALTPSAAVESVLSIFEGN